MGKEILEISTDMKDSFLLLKKGFINETTHTDGEKTKLPQQLHVQKGEQRSSARGVECW